MCVLCIYTATLAVLCLHRECFPQRHILYMASKMWPFSLFRFDFLVNKFCSGFAVCSLFHGNRQEKLETPLCV